MIEVLENTLVFLNNQDYLEIFIYIFIIYMLIVGWKKGSLLLTFFCAIKYSCFLKSINLSIKRNGYLCGK